MFLSHFLTGKSSSYQEAGGGIKIQLYNSSSLLVITLFISVPLSMGLEFTWLSIL